MSNTGNWVVRLSFWTTNEKYLSKSLEHHEKARMAIL